MLFSMIMFGLTHQLSVKVLSFIEGKEIKFKKFGSTKIYTLLFENDKIVNTNHEDALASCW
jgi:hypothetical protein